MNGPQGFDKNKHGACWCLYSDHFILFSEDCASVLIFRLNNQTVCYVSKTFVFQCIKGYTLGKYPAFLGLFVWIEKDRESCQMQHMRS